MVLTFPADPAVGQVFDTGVGQYQWDGEKWRAIALASPPYVGPPGPPGADGPVGPQGEPGEGWDGGYYHVQMVASSTWSIHHNLSRYPVPIVMDTAGSEVLGDVEYPDTNTVILTFSAPFSGTAQLV